MHRRPSLTIAAYAYLFTMLGLLFFPLLSRAQGTAGVVQYSTRTATNSALTATGYHSTAAAACEVFRSSADSWSTTSAPHTYRVDYTGTTPSLCNIINKLGGVSYTGGFVTQTNQVALPCPASGEQRTINFTTGYTEDPQYRKNATDNQLMAEWTNLTANGSSCITGGGSSCTASVTPDASNLKKLWISATPNAQGLYRLSADYTVTFTGASCAPTTAQRNLTDATATPATCNGTYGTVNGKAVCVPSSTATRNVVSASGGGTTATVGNPGAGTSGAVPLSSRVPASGTGNNDGGPVTAIDGSPVNIGSPLPTTATSGGSTGATSGTTGPTNDDAKTCGRPGQPACKIDETGTPANATTDGLGGLNQGYDTLGETLDAIKNANGKDTSWGIVPTWLQASASCHPVVLMTLPEKLGNRQITLDICPYMDKIYLLMNTLWVVWTFGAVVSMVFRVTSAGVS